MNSILRPTYKTLHKNVPSVNWGPLLSCLRNGTFRPTYLSKTLQKNETLDSTDHLELVVTSRPPSGGSRVYMGIFGRRDVCTSLVIM